MGNLAKFPSLSTHTTLELAVPPGGKAQVIDRDPRSILRDYLFIQGFPQRFSRFTTLGGNASFSESLANGAMVRYREKDKAAEEREQFDQDLPAYKFLDDNFLEPHQFALNFWVEPDHFVDPESKPSAIKDWSEVFEGGQSLPGQRPRGAYGLSGSPVWRIGASGRSSREWSPEWSQLVGVVTHWDRSAKILIATSSSKIFELC